MFTRILAPIDTHADAIAAATLAEQVAYRTRGELILLRVIPETATAPEMSAHRDDLERLAADINERSGILPRVAVVMGQPEARILETAEREQADLIVLAPHARSGLEALRHRSVTMRLVAHARIPLLVAPQHSGGAWPVELLTTPTSLVIVPVDGAALSERAIGIGERVADMWGRPLLLLRVISPLDLYGAGPDTTILERTLREEDAQLAHQALHNLRERVARQTSVAVEAMVKPGTAEQVIAQAADSYPGSLVVMSTHGRNATQRAMLGSVTQSVLERAHEPTLILPPAAAIVRPVAPVATAVASGQQHE